jgi:4-hydroxy-tetrahydrodipicolinate synthase
MPTPFTPDGDIDGGRVRQLVEFLLEGGVDGLFPLGTTGEFALLSRSERKKVVSLTVDAANGRVPVLCGVSDPATENVRCFIRDAEDAGSDGVVVTPPYYFRLKGEQECYSYFSGISRMTDLPLFVYNIPEWTGTLIPAEALSRLAEEGLIAGMKYTEYNLLALLKYIDSLKGRIALFTGSDAMAYTNLEFGGDGAIIAVSNVAPRRAASIYDLLESGDASGDGTGYSLTISKHYESVAKELKEKAKEQQDSAATAQQPASTDAEDGPKKRAFACVFRLMDLSTKMYIACGSSMKSEKRRSTGR